MLANILLAVQESKTEKRFRNLLKNPDVLVNSVLKPENLWETVSRESFDLVFLSLGIIGSSASETVNSLSTLPDSPAIVVLSDRDDPDERTELLAAGCVSVLNTGVEDAILEEAIASILQRRLETVEESITPHEPDKTPQLSDFISSSPAMQTFMSVVHRVVASDATLLIMGETGVGKERLARAIHAESPRSNGPFVSINCGALSETLLESELFGHEEGAFTGASRARRGWFELAHNGTIFLDEIGEMPKHLQVKLLTVLQTREVQRVGAESNLHIDVRIIAATNLDLMDEVKAGRFRRDLYYRLSVVSLTIPPLNERREDIPALINHFLDHFRGEIPNRITSIRREAEEALCSYDWPGNVRELMNVIERAMLLAEGDQITLAELPVSISGLSSAESILPTPELIEEESLRIPSEWLQLPLAEARERLLTEFERSYLDGLLRANSGKINRTAQQAGIRPRSLYEKMKRLGLSKEDYK